MVLSDFFLEKLEIGGSKLKMYWENMINFLLVSPLFFQDPPSKPETRMKAR